MVQNNKIKCGYDVEAEYRVTEIEKFLQQSNYLTEKELHSTLIHPSCPLLRMSCSFLTNLVSFRLYFYFAIITIFDSCFSICDPDHEEGDIEAGMQPRSDGVTKRLSCREG